MSWPLRLVEWNSEPKAIGDCWYIPESQIKTGQDGRRYWYGHKLSRDYENKRTQRQPIAVVLPSTFGGCYFCVDSKATDNGGDWTVSGELPNLTISPSINIGGIYHGWIRGGEISPDCEGRKYEVANG